MTIEENQDLVALQKELGEKRIAEAMAAIERAQSLLGKACEALCPIIGGQPSWNRVGKLVDGVRDTWYRVRDFAEKQRTTPGGLRCDETHAAYYLKNAGDASAAKETPRGSQRVD